MSETVLAQPVTQIAYQGNKVLQIQAGSGSLQSPVAAIEVSSSFGESRGSRVHLGVDFRSPKGTAIMAADGFLFAAIAFSKQPPQSAKP